MYAAILGEETVRIEDSPDRHCEGEARGSLHSDELAQSCEGCQRPFQPPSVAEHEGEVLYSTER